MIVINTAESHVEVTILGEFNIADYKEFEDAVNYTVRFEGPVDLLFDARQMLDFTLDVALEDLKFGRAHQNDFSRIALVTENQWLSWAVWLGNIFSSADLRAFTDLEEARRWLEIGPPETPDDTTD